MAAAFQSNAFQTNAFQTVAVEIIAVDSATLALAPQAVSIRDTELIVSGALAFSGSAIGERETLSIATTALSFTGQDIVVSEVSSENVPITAQSLTFAPQAISVRDAEIVSPAVLSFTGQNILAIDADRISITAGALALAGSAISERETITIVSPSLTFTGSLITVIDGERIPIAAGALTFTGSSITVTDIAPSDVVTVNNAQLILVGQDITIIEPIEPGGRYRALGDILLPGNVYVESGTIFTGPSGWIPSISVDPIDDNAIQAYWNAGPAGMGNADMVSAYGAWGTWNRRSGVFVQVASIRWVPAGEDMFILTGDGEALGPKSAP
jgi:hypothetical protein